MVAFAEEYSLPIAIKAAHGGGGKGMKVARTIDERDSGAVPGRRCARPGRVRARGECYVEARLDKPPRHVGLGDRRPARQRRRRRHQDCSLQRRYQKLVEEAPAPF
ncbi:hypothetical protein ABLN97_02395 [Mycobacterium tuberculosis]